MVLKVTGIVKEEQIFSGQKNSSVLDLELDMWTQIAKIEILLAKGCHYAIGKLVM